MNGETKDVPVNRGAIDSVSEVRMLFNRTDPDVRNTRSPWDRPIDEIFSLCLFSAAREAEREMDAEIKVREARRAYFAKGNLSRLWLRLLRKKPGVIVEARSETEILHHYLTRTDVVFAWVECAITQPTSRLHAMMLIELRAKALELHVRLKRHLYSFGV